ncbi:MAG: DUF4421 domain-containing protein [Cyclobacteriaceae bacterium]
MHRKLPYIISLLLIPARLWSQDPDVTVSQPSLNFDITYLKSYSDLLSLKFYGVTKSNQIILSDDFIEELLIHQPNEQFNIGFGFNYKWLGLDLAFNFPFINDDDELYGKTSRLDVQSNVYTRRFAVDFNFQRYKGYHLRNPEVYVPTWDPKNPVYPLRPDIRSSNISGNFFYIFNHKKFSYRSTFVFNERQLKSKGSWLAGAYIGYFTMMAEDSLVPEELRADVNPDNNYKETTFFSAGLSFGYAHIFVIKKKFFWTPTLAIGIGPEVRTVGNKGDADYRNTTEAGSKIFFRTALGYNSDRSFFGITAVAETVGAGDENESFLQHSVNNLRLFYGRRFNVGKK